MTTNRETDIREINPYFIELQPIFGVRRKVGATLHNVGALFTDSTPDLIHTIDLRYGQRVGHLPRADRSFAIVPEVTDDIRNQMDYLSGIFGFTVTPTTLADFKGKVGDTQAETPLIVPYKNLAETKKQIESVGAESWGLSPKVADLLGNKASFHELIRNMQEQITLRVPDYKIATRKTFITFSHRLLHETQEKYERVDMANDYPLGLIIRPAAADGGYGSYGIKQLPNGKIRIIPDLDGKLADEVETWEEALSKAKEHIYKTIDPEKDPEIVISRYIDKKASPGNSFIAKQGKVISLGLNHQIQHEGSEACEGVTSFTDTASLPTSRDQFESQIAQDVTTLMQHASEITDVPLEEISGAFNIDLMLIPDDTLEAEYLRRNNVDPRSIAYTAECNARFPSTIDVELLGLNVYKQPQTSANARALINKGLHAIDKYQIKGMDPRKFRDRVAALDDSLSRRDIGRAVTRMTQSPAGLALFGDIVVVKNSIDLVTGMKDNPSAKELDRLVEKVIYEKNHN